MIASEVAPLVKVGGLGDVIEGLSKALAARGHEVRIVCPKYKCVTLDESWVERDETLNVGLGKGVECKVWEGMVGLTGAKGYLLENEVYFGTGDVYQSKSRWVDRRRFAVLSHGGLDLMEQLGWEPDVVHVHDWITALGCEYSRYPTLLTIHNMCFQGQFNEEVLGFYGVSDESMWRKGNGTNLLKGGILCADGVTTVSPNYAEEVLGGKEGCGLAEALRGRGDAFMGILNGIDVEQWDPSVDKHIAENYSSGAMTGKMSCKVDLQERMGLEVDEGIAVMGVVARMYDQKGLDLLAAAVPKLMEEWRVQLVVMGQGDSDLEEVYRNYSRRYEGRVGVMIGYDEALAHKLWAGTDFYLMPSRFEPCGLSQMYAMRYGSVPIVRSVGGLVDTVIGHEHEGGTGVVFREARVEDLYGAMREGLRLYYNKCNVYEGLQRNGMMRDGSWDTSVEKYLALYEDLAGVGAGA